MSLGNKTIKLVQKLLKSKKKRKLYTDDELKYMEIQLARLEAIRKRRLKKRKEQKGFAEHQKENFDSL